MRTVSAAVVVVVWAGWLGFGTFGCASGRVGSELAVKPRPHRIESSAPVVLRVPQDEPFNIVLPSNSRRAGLDGTAESDADAHGDGRAHASVAVTGSGMAEATIQLGHAVANDTGRQADYTFSVQVEYECTAVQEPAVFLPDAQVHLRVYARLDSGRIVRDIAIVGHTTENGPIEQHGNEQVSFTLTLGPHESVSVFVAGQARADISAERTARAALALRAVAMEVSAQPAPAVRTTGDERS